MPDQLDLRLAELGRAVAFPATPPLAGAVTERLAQPRRAWFWPGRRPLGRSAALALGATLLLVGIAAGFGITVGGLRLVFGPATGSPLPSLAVGPGLGEATTIAQAREQIRFTLRVPTLAGLGDPDLVYLAERPAGGAVTLLYGDRGDIPADAATGVGLIVTQFRADIGPDTFEKLILQGTLVIEARVNGHAAWWVEGGQHFFFYRDADGEVVDTTLRLAGDTLIWEERGVTHRVEGAPSLDVAIGVAESLE